MSDIKRDIVIRAYTLYFGFILVMLVVIYKTFQLQLSDKEVAVQVKMVERYPRMGEILDANSNPLVTSVSYYDIHMDPTVCEQKVFDAEVSNLAAGLNKLYPEKLARQYENSIRKARAEGSRYLLIRKKTTNEQRQKIRNLPILNLGRMKGGIIDNEETVLRKKPNGILLNRTLGYYNKAENLEVGIEGAYHKYLEGSPGVEIEQRISTGWKKTGQITKDAIEGADVVTTFDKDIQEVAHSELEKQLRDMRAESGTVILMEVKTGHVKAMANLTREEDGTFSEKYNLAIGGREVPGSTMKLASIMAGLEDNKFKITDKVNAFGVYSLYGRKLSDSNHGNGYGTITIQKAFEKSSNVIAMLMNNVYKNDPESFLARLDQFGLTEPLGIELSGEAAPIFYKPGDKMWSVYSLPWMSIGYEYQQTPLQTAAFYNAVANNGKFLRPLFVKEIRRNGRVIKSFKPVVLREKICSDQSLKIMKSCLEGVMLRGTGQELKSVQFNIAGKTGTAKLIGKNKTYEEEGASDYQASFAGYFPASNPRYTCVVVISRPKEQYYGSKVSGTVFAAIANKIFASNLKYHKSINRSKTLQNDFPTIKVAHHYDAIKLLKYFKLKYNISGQSPWLTSESNPNRIAFSGRQEVKGKVPNVVGMTAKDAVYVLENSGLIVSISGKGVVVSQSMGPAENIFKGGLIELKLK